MRVWLLCGALLVAPVAVLAASGPDQYITGSGATVTGAVQETLDGSNVPHPTGPSFPAPVTTTPSATTIQGTLALTTSSVSLSTGSYLNVLTGAGASFTMPPPNNGQVTIKNNGDSTSNARLCLWGNSPACTNGATSNGKILEPGASTTVRLTGGASPNAICDLANGCNLSITE